MKYGDQQRITQHKRFLPYSTHPNFCFAKNSFMLGTLCVMLKETTVLKINIKGINKRNAF